MGVNGVVAAVGQFKEFCEVLHSKTVIYVTVYTNFYKRMSFLCL